MEWTSQRHKKRIRLIGVLVLAAAVLIAAGIGLGKLLRTKPLPIDIGLPGAAAGETLDFCMDTKTADALAARMSLLLENEKTGLFTQRYILAGQFGEPPAERSTVYLANDQLLYGQYLLEQGRRDDFRNWWRSFSEAFVLDSGLVAPTRGQSEDEAKTDERFWRVNLAAIRLLAQSSSGWPDKGRQAAFSRLSDQLIQIGGKGFTANYEAAVPTAPPILDPAATPTPKPTATPAMTDPLATVKVLRLSSIDLFTLQQLARFDERWQWLFDHYLPIVKEGYISDALPLYALGYVEGSGYLMFDGDSPLLNTEEALTTLLHLCEAGEGDSRSISWLRDQMFNSRAVYESYHIAQGHAGTAVESVPSYAIIARIARIEGDADLYRSAVNRLLWHQATSQTSPALSAVFRQADDGRIHVLASDNALALLALR